MENRADKFILAISTSSGVARVAAALENKLVLFQFEITDYKSQSAQLLPTLHANFQARGLQSSQVAAVAVDVGPGGFTSLRTACGVAQGLAVAWKVPTVPMSSFECMLPADVVPQPLTVMIDARLNELYTATLCRTSAGTQWAVPPGLLACADIAKVNGPVFCDTAVLALREAAGLESQLGEVSAVRLAVLAWQEFNAGRLHAPMDCQPQYVRDKVAQTTSERLALKHGAV